MSRRSLPEVLGIEACSGLEVLSGIETRSDLEVRSGIETRSGFEMRPRIDADERLADPRPARIEESRCLRCAAS
jgi:hypothetical protein